MCIKVTADSETCVPITALWNNNNSTGHVTDDKTLFVLV